MASKIASNATGEERVGCVAVGERVSAAVGPPPPSCLHNALRTALVPLPQLAHARLQVAPDIDQLEVRVEPAQHGRTPDGAGSHQCTHGKIRER